MVTILTRTIGPSGRDYASFTLAEADVENIGTSADLVANDEAIVFEADAGTYDESVVFVSSLTTDATRNVTCKPAAGSEHGGSPDSGVILNKSGNTGQAVRIVTPYTVLRGLVVLNQYGSTANYGIFITTAGHGSRVEDCIVKADGLFAAIAEPPAFDTTAAQPAAVFKNNCIQISVSGATIFRAIELRGAAANDCYMEAVNNTLITDAGARAVGVGVNSGAGTTASYLLTNNLVIGLGVVDTYVPGGSGTKVVTGSNNFGGSTNPFPVAIQGSPYPITASTAYDPGAGDFALYVGKNGALLDSPNNDVIDQGVGPSANSDVPTTDILGNARSGATANPGAFEQPQATATITKTIGPSGRDYTTFTLAEADVTNIGGSADLVNENERIVFEADAGTYAESVTFQSTLTTDATRNVTYKPAAGSEHGGVAGQGVHLVYTVASTTLKLHDAHTVVEGLSATNPIGFTLTFVLGSDGAIARRCIVESTAATATASAVFYGPNGAGTTITIQDSVIKTSGIAYAIRGKFNCNMRIRNCTLQSPLGILVETLSRPSSIELLNNLSIGPSYSQTGAGVVTLTGSNNFGEDGGFPWPVAVAGTPATITATTSFSTPLGSGDYAVYMGATGALARVTGNDVWQQGVGPASNSDVPTTDINGVTRSGTSCNPGAFEADGFVAPTVLTRTIGSGKDYSTFTLAEAAVTSIGSGTDLTFYNEAIVFEADAGTYNEAVDINSTLTTDATRQVTYKPAAGSEHGGAFGAGVHVAPSSGHAFTNQDDYTALIGLGTETIGYGYGVRSSGVGVIVDGLMMLSDYRCLVGFCNSSRPTCTMTVRNCVMDIDTSSGVSEMAAIPFADGSGLSADIVFINCTVIRSALYAFYYLGRNSATLTGSLTNCLSLAGQSYRALAQTGSTVTVTGSNNFGGSSDPFPAALQGSPYPITPTTNTSPGAGDWAIYDADTGALVNVPANDVLNKGVGPIIKSEVPTTDIVGATRANFYADPGAFQASAVLPQQEATQAFGAAVSHQRAVTRQRATVSAGATAHVTSGGLR